ncbi:carbohydrate ABC transporter permease [Kineococcus rubinsiae]|uniref:carbohydrate ABC transporter permease n=1 Tax=Kineococcus rubinsiae TaxID=2609562 RepID=UPI001431AD82|nr:carbohydrate ABC transporter permease [Kineococcus rubinsiae]NIZ92217.1 carbohydrate ABC transporter permease [Kineococcus rubinsiae]
MSRTAPDTVARSAPARRPARRLPVGGLVAYAVLVVLAVVYVFPFLIQVANAFKTDGDATADPLDLLPLPGTTAAFTTLFTQLDFPRAAMNSAVVAVAVTLGRVFFDCLAGYALARLPFRGRGLVFAGFVAVIAVPPVVLLIPKFLVLNQLGIYDSYAGMIVPLMADAGGVFIMKSFFESVPRSVEEASYLDGAGTFRTFWSIVLPMARPAVVTITILSFQASWNELSHFVVSRSSPDLNTLTTLVATLTSGGAFGQANQYPLKLAAAALMTIPVAVLFFVFQRQVMAGTEGAVKE